MAGADAALSRATPRIGARRQRSTLPSCRATASPVSTPASQQFTEWPLPANANPHGLVVDAQGLVWYTGNGNGTHRPSRPGQPVEVREYRPPSGGDPHTIVIDEQGRSLVHRPARSTRRQAGARAVDSSPSIRAAAIPYGLAIDAQGVIWFCRLRGRQARLDRRRRAARPGNSPPGSGSAPRRIAAAPDGDLWVSLLRQRQARPDSTRAPDASRETFDLPQGRRSRGRMQ
jgi:streptogramin lyase